jgi:peptidoglycan/xylan/chitin deacetylase (PgdA/CDA1 family)
VLPGTLELEANGNLYAFDLNGKNDFFDRNFGAFTGLSYWNPNPDPRHKLYFSLWKILRESTPVRQQAILDKLAGWAGASGSGYAMNYTFSTEQLVALSRQPLVEIGAHTVNHPSLPALPARDQEAEIKQSRKSLEHITNKPVTHFSYPYGDHSEVTKKIVREAGFLSACSTTESAFRLPVDRFALPRLQVMDWGGDEFERMLSGAFNN